MYNFNSMAQRAARPKPRLPAGELWEYAVKALGSRAHSTGELRRKLVLRAEKAADVDDVISKLRDYGYLNDKRFSETYASFRLENQGLGKTRVVRDLRQRKVSSGLAEVAVNHIYRDVNEIELIENYIRRKFHPKTPLPEALKDPKQLAAAYRRLIRAGFSSSNVIQMLKRISKGNDLLDGFEPPEEIEEV